MKIRLVIEGGARWAFRAEPEEEAEARAESRAGAQGVLLRLWQRLLARYHAARQRIEAAERMRWIREGLRRLEARSDPSESFMRRMRTASEVVLLYPESLSAALVRRRFLRFLRRRSRAHARGMVLTALLLPVTAAMAILPGPNIFFAWNAYRLIAHALARQGARRVLRGECALRLQAVAEGDTVASLGPGASRGLHHGSRER
jgi:hypothetical protein